MSETAAALPMFCPMSHVIPEYLDKEGETGCTSTLHPESAASFHVLPHSKIHRPQCTELKKMRTWITKTMGFPSFSFFFPSYFLIFICHFQAGEGFSKYGWKWGKEPEQENLILLSSSEQNKIYLHVKNKSWSYIYIHVCMYTCMK